ncbi:MAG TPA: VTT domain-containing protein [Terriglobia bacterium]|nr:VTT domain-containing protein [Terriglobia bacterium]
MHYLQSFAIRLGRFLARYGGLGLFGINVLDSSILPIPVINDLLLIHLASRQPALAMVYALDCTAGSVAGSFAMYGISRWGGNLFRRRSTPSTGGRARQWLERNDFVTVLVASLLPPPTPFKVVPLAAGAMEVNPWRFGAALVVGRGLRFVAEALIGVRYGAKAETYLKYHIAFLSIATAASVIVITLVYRRLQKAAL